MDHVDSILEQWALQRPDLDTSPMAVIGRLSRASAIVDAELSANFARHGVDAATFDVLATLVRQGEPHQMTPAALAADAMITTSAVAQRLNRLDTLGLITRHPDPADGRGKVVQLTPSGKEIVNRVLPAHLATEAHLLRHFDSEQQEMLAALLSHFSATPVR
ncbi:MarR family transcriptional regulator [Microbacterium sp. NPDC076911]|uniref:MarR family winged helix-turn-helix transcriptional regulator n=1 Tax=Microbacterium sp. NPDC076911 TaxID=3154958 RepID=UPI00341AB182